MKKMRKIISMALALLMILSFAAVPSFAEDSAATEKILLNGANFEVPQYPGVNGGYVDNGGSAENNLFDKSIRITSAACSTAKIYIASEGTYNIWVLSANEGDFTDRYATVGVDDSEMQSLTPHKNHKWEKTEWTLAKGWHEIKLGIPTAWKNVLVNAVYITNDTDFALTTDDNDNIKAYADNAAPVFADDADIITSFSGKVCSVTFPAADGACVYEYSLGTASGTIEDITQPISVSDIADGETATLTAYDKCGNKTVKTFKITVPSDIPGSEKMLLNGANFEIPEYPGVGGYVGNGGSAENNLFDKSIRITSSANSTAKIYIANEGTYNIWVLSGNENGAADRYATVGVDNEAMRSLTPHKNHKWEKTEWTLAKGWHEIKLGIIAAWKNTLINAVYITNDTDFALTTDNDDALIAYSDNDAPVFADGADAKVTLESGKCYVAFPAADDKSRVIYSCTNGGEVTDIEDITKPVHVNGITENTFVILTAADKFGNNAEKVFTLSAPRTKWLLAWNNFYKPSFGDSEKWEYSAASSLAGKSIFINTVPAYRNESNAARAKAMFYAENDGEYTLWVLGKTTKANDGRVPQIYVDGIADDTVFNDTTEFSWGKSGKTLSLSEGWHSIEVGLRTEYKPFWFEAVYITSDASETVTADNDDFLLKSYGGSSVNINGDVRFAKSLEKTGFVSEDDSVIITPLPAASTADGATVTVNGAAAAWNEPFEVSLGNVINTVSAASSDSSVNYSFKVFCVGSVINRMDDKANVTGGIESAYIGADGTNAVYLAADGTARFSAENRRGKQEVWVYAIGAAEDSLAAASANVKIVCADGEKTAAYSNAAAQSSWIKLGEFNFSGAEDEYIEISGAEGANVYVDSVRFKCADEYVLSSKKAAQSNGKVSFVYEYYKQSDAEKSVAAIIASYSGNAMKNMSVSTQTHDEAGVYTVSTNALEAEDGCEYKGFVWDSIGRLMPISESHSYTPNNN